MKREKEREKSASAHSFTQYRHKHSNRERKLFLMLKYLCLFEFIMLALNAEQCTIVDAIAIATAQYNGCCRFCSISLFFFFKMKREKKKSALKWKLCNYHFKIGWIWENYSSLLNSFILIALDSVDLLAITVQCTKRTWYNVYAYRGHKWSFRHINLLLTDYTQPWWNDVENVWTLDNTDVLDGSTLWRKDQIQFTHVFVRKNYVLLRFQIA